MKFDKINFIIYTYVHSSESFSSRSCRQMYEQIIYFYIICSTIELYKKNRIIFVIARTDEMCVCVMMINILYPNGILLWCWVPFP